MKVYIVFKKILGFIYFFFLIVTPVDGMMAVHELTAALASSASVAQLKQAGIQALEAVSTSRDGTVTVKVKAGSASGYGACWWDVRVGGEGQGADEDVAWGGHPRGPVLVKFMQPYFHMPGVREVILVILCAVVQVLPSTIAYNFTPACVEVTQCGDTNTVATLLCLFSYRVSCDTGYHSPARC